MRVSHRLQLLLATLSASFVAHPVSSTQAGPSSATDAGRATSIDLDLTLQHPVLRGTVVPGSSSTSPIVLESSFQHPSSSAPTSRELDAILSHMPVARSDVVSSMLSTRFNLNSNVPLQRILTPTERAAIRWMSGQHLTMPGLTWVHAVVDEPDVDLRIKKKLYVAAPITKPELEKAVGIPRTPASGHGLLVAFHEAPLDQAMRHPFRMAGIEMVRDEDEARRVLPFLHAVLAPEPHRPKINRQMGFEDSISNGEVSERVMEFINRLANQGHLGSRQYKYWIDVQYHPKQRQTLLGILFAKGREPNPNVLHLGTDESGAHLAVSLVKPNRAAAAILAGRMGMRAKGWDSRSGLVLMHLKSNERPTMVGSLRLKNHNAAAKIRKLPELITLDEVERLHGLTGIGRLV